MQSHDKDCCRCGANAHFVEISGKAKAVEAGIVHALAASLDEDEDKLLVYCLQCIANIGESKAARNLLRSLALQIAELQNHNQEVVQRSAMFSLCGRSILRWLDGSDPNELDEDCSSISVLLRTTEHIHFEGIVHCESNSEKRIRSS